MLKELIGKTHDIIYKVGNDDPAWKHMRLCKQLMKYLEIQKQWCMPQQFDQSLKLKNEEDRSKIDEIKQMIVPMFIQQNYLDVQFQNRVFVDGLKYSEVIQLHKCASNEFQALRKDVGTATVTEVSEKSDKEKIENSNQSK